MMSQPVIRGILFDMDGLLVDTERIARQSWKYAGEQCGVEITDDFYGSVIGIGKDDSDRALIDRFGQDFPLSRFKEFRYAKMRSLLHGAELLKKGAGEIVEFVHEQGIPAGLVTSSRHDDVHERLGSLVNNFRIIVAREDVRHGKPAPDLYLEAVRRIEINPENLVVLEDSPIGAQAALNAELNVILVPDLVQPDAELTRRVLKVCRDLVDARNYLVDTLK